CDFEESGRLAAPDAVSVVGIGESLNKTRFTYRKRLNGKTRISPLKHLRGIIAEVAAFPLDDDGKRTGQRIAGKVINGWLVEVDHQGRAEIEITISNYREVSLEYYQTPLPDNERRDFPEMFAMGLISSIRDQLASSASGLQKITDLVDRGGLSLEEKLDLIARTDFISDKVKLQAIADVMAKYACYNGTYAEMEHNGVSWGSTWADIIESGERIRLICDTSSRMFVLMCQRLGAKAAYVQLEPLKRKSGFIIRGGIPHAMAIAEVDGKWVFVETTRLIPMEAGIAQGGGGTAFEGEAEIMSRSPVLDLAPREGLPRLANSERGITRDESFERVESAYESAQMEAHRRAMHANRSTLEEISKLRSQPVTRDTLNALETILSKRRSSGDIYKKIAAFLSEIIASRSDPEIIDKAFRLLEDILRKDGIDVFAYIRVGDILREIAERDESPEKPRKAFEILQNWLIDEKCDEDHGLSWLVCNLAEIIAADPELASDITMKVFERALKIEDLAWWGHTRIAGALAAIAGSKDKASLIKESTIEALGRPGPRHASPFYMHEEVVQALGKIAFLRSDLREKIKEMLRAIVSLEKNRIEEKTRKKARELLAALSALGLQPREQTEETEKREQEKREQEARDRELDRQERERKREIKERVEELKQTVLTADDQAGLDALGELKELAKKEESPEYALKALGDIIRDRPGIVQQSVVTFLEELMDSGRFRPSSYPFSLLLDCWDGAIKARPDLVTDSTLNRARQLFFMKNDDSIDNRAHVLENIALHGSSLRLRLGAFAALTQAMQQEGLPRETYIFTAWALGRIFRDSNDIKVKRTALAALKRTAASSEAEPDAWRAAVGELATRARDEHSLGKDLHAEILRILRNSVSRLISIIDDTAGSEDYQDEKRHEDAVHTLCEIVEAQPEAVTQEEVDVLKAVRLDYGLAASSVVGAFVELARCNPRYIDQEIIDLMEKIAASEHGRYHTNYMLGIFFKSVARQPQTWRFIRDSVAMTLISTFIVE
ncbi:MAG: hypothetical protein PVH45_05680, partial [Candidatus Omnitrophota bacterium]